jgi:hypothetical protein
MHDVRVHLSLNSQAPQLQLCQCETAQDGRRCSASGGCAAPAGRQDARAVPPRDAEAVHGEPSRRAPHVDLVRGNDGGFWRLIEQRSRKPENPSQGKACFFGDFGDPEERVGQDRRLPHEALPSVQRAPWSTPKTSRHQPTTGPGSGEMDTGAGGSRVAPAPALQISGEAKNGSFYRH